MKKYLLAWAMVLLVSGNVFAQQESGSEKTKGSEAKTQEQEMSPKKLLRKYQKEAATEMGKFQAEAMKAQREAAKSGDPKAIAAAMKEIQGKMEKAVSGSVGKIIELVKSNDSVELADSAVKAISRLPVSSKSKNELFGVIADRYANDKKVTRLFGVVSSGIPSKGAADFLDAIIAKSNNKHVKAHAELAKVDLGGSLLRFGNLLKSNPQFADAYPEIAEMFKAKSDSLSEEGFKKQYEMLVEKYGDVKYRRSTVKDFAMKKIKAIEIRARVKVGKVAPEIEGPDMDGTKFKLSDYRGKVVMLDFWGDW